MLVRIVAKYGAGCEIGVQSDLSVAHECLNPLTSDLIDKSVSIGGPAGVGVRDGCFRCVGSRGANADCEAWGGQARCDLDHLHDAACRVVLGDVPHRTSRYTGVAIVASRSTKPDVERTWDASQPSRQLSSRRGTVAGRRGWWIACLALWLACCARVQRPPKNTVQ